MTNPKTLYKLMVLYMLKKVNFPLSNPQLWSFFEQSGYTNYFVFQETVQGLLDANLITSESIRNILYYDITKEGNEALYYFLTDISEEIKADMNQYLSANQFQLRNETGVTADYYKTNQFDYCVHLKVREGKNILFELNITVPTEEQAKSLSLSLEENAQTIYSYIMKNFAP